MYITGISYELFESLRDVIEKHYSPSFYSQAKENEKLKAQVEQLTQEIARLKRESNDKRDGFHRY